MADWGSWQCWLQIVGFFAIFLATIWIFIMDHPWWINWYDWGRTTPRTTAPTTTSTLLQQILMTSTSLPPPVRASLNYDEDKSFELEQHSTPAN